MSAISNPTGCCNIATGCCPNDAIPQTLHAQWTTTGNCPGFNGAGNSLPFDGSSQKWQNLNISLCGGNYAMTFWCDETSKFRISLTTNSGPCAITLLGANAFEVTCNPFIAKYGPIQITPSPGCSCCTASDFGLEIVITE